MDIQTQLTIGVLIVFPHLFINVSLSKEIFLWEPSLTKRIFLMFIVWFIPFIGAIVAYKSLNLDWFKKSKESSRGENSITSGGLLEIDAIFNPGQRHVITATQKEHVEVKEDGELYNEKSQVLTNKENEQVSGSSDQT